MTSRTAHPLAGTTLADLAAVTIPLAGPRKPSGLQLAAAPGRDADLIALALSVETAVCRRAPPDVTAFANRSAIMEVSA